MTSHLLVSRRSNNGHDRSNLNHGDTKRHDMPVTEKAKTSDAPIVRRLSIPLLERSRSRRDLESLKTHVEDSSADSLRKDNTGNEDALLHSVAAKDALARHLEPENVKEEKLSHGSPSKQLKFFISTGQARSSVGTIYNSESFKQFIAHSDVVRVGRDKLERALPSVDIKYIRKKWAIGQGSFGAVYCATVVCPCCGGPSKLKNEKMIHSYEAGGLAPQYVMKRVPGSTIERQKEKNGVPPSKDEKQKFSQSITDLVVEAHILAGLNHPHIIKVKGVASCDTNCQDFFFLMDHLSCNLSVRIHQCWEKKQQSYAKEKNTWATGMFPRKVNSIFQNSTQKKLAKLWIERISIARDIVDAIKYMHQKRLIHRDIKPKNIGFRLGDDSVQLFDFGTAIQITSTDPNCFVNSGRVGSRRYMAPEVFNRHPYNESADMFSFVLVLWEMLSFTKPPDWNGLASAPTSPDRSSSSTVASLHVSHNRPPIPATWSACIRGALSLGWSVNPSDRLSAESFLEVLESELTRCRTTKTHFLQ